MERLKDSKQKAQVTTYSTAVANRLSVLEELNEDISSWAFSALGVSRPLKRTRLTTDPSPGSNRNRDPRRTLLSKVHLPRNAKRKVTTRHSFGS